MARTAGRLIKEHKALGFTHDGWADCSCTLAKQIREALGIKTREVTAPPSLTLAEIVEQGMAFERGFGPTEIVEARIAVLVQLRDAKLLLREAARYVVHDDSDGAGVPTDDCTCTPCERHRASGCHMCALRARIEEASR